MKNTHIILSATPSGGLTAEAITPGTISERRTAFIGTTQNQYITGAVFDAFIGPNARDIVGKRQTGRGMLWAAHGFPFKPFRGDGVVVGIADADGNMKLDGEGAKEMLVPSTSIFRLPRIGDKEKPAPLLLRRIGSA